MLDTWHNSDRYSYFRLTVDELSRRARPRTPSDSAFLSPRPSVRPDLPPSPGGLADGGPQLLQVRHCVRVGVSAEGVAVDDVRDQVCSLHAWAGLRPKEVERVDDAVECGPWDDARAPGLKVGWGWCILPIDRVPSGLTWVQPGSVYDLE